MERKAFANLKTAYRIGIKRYSGSAFTQMNSFLRKMGVGKAKWGDISSDLEMSIKNAMAGLRTASLDRELYLRRGSDLSDLAGLMGDNFDDNLKSLNNLFRNWDEYFKSPEEAIAHINSMFEGTVGTFHGFTSTSSIWERGFSGEVEYIFKAPKGTGGMSIMDISRYGTMEGEFLLNAGTRVKVKKVLPSDGHKSSRIRVFLEIIV